MSLLIDHELQTLRHNVSWSEFENILTEMGERRSAMVVYGRGMLEITMPSQRRRKIYSACFLSGKGV